MLNLLAHNYLTRGFWGDEAWTSMISRLPYSQMLKTTASDFHPPGYYTLIGLVYKFLPPTEVNTRFVSLVFYFLTAFMVYKLASYVRGRTFGILSAVVVLLNPIFFTYAFEARNYTMFAFAATGSVFFLIELSKKFTKLKALGFVLFTLLGIYTHYYMFFILCAEGLYLLLFDRKILFKVTFLYLIDAILYLPWLKALLSQLASVNSSYWIGSIDWKRTHYEALLRILGGENPNILRDLLFPLSIILLVVGILQHVLRKKFEKPYLLIWLWAVVPFVLATLPGLKIGGFHFPFRPIFFWRYLLGSSVPFAMLMVHSSQKLPKYLMVGSVCVILILSFAIDLLTFTSEPYSFREAYREKIVGKINQSDSIVTILPSFAEVIYYRDRNNIKNPIIVLNEGLVQFSGKSLLDTYSADKIVTVGELPNGSYFDAERNDSGQIVIIKK